MQYETFFSIDFRKICKKVLSVQYNKAKPIPHRRIEFFWENFFIRWIKIITWQSRGYAENPRDTAVIRGLRPSREFFRQNKKHVLDEVNASMCAKYQVCIVFRLARRRDKNKYIHKYTSEIRNILDQLLASRGF